MPNTPPDRSRTRKLATLQTHLAGKTDDELDALAIQHAPAVTRPDELVRDAAGGMPTPEISKFTMLLYWHVRNKEHAS